MLFAVPMTLTEAKAFVTSFHRHNKAPQGGLFAVGVSDGDRLIGVATVGRPVARKLDDGRTVEVTRCCVMDGSPKGTCSFLYSRCSRAAFRAGLVEGHHIHARIRKRSEPTRCRMENGSGDSPVRRGNRLDDAARAGVAGRERADADSVGDGGVSDSLATIVAEMRGWNRVDHSFPQTRITDWADRLSRLSPPATDTQKPTVSAPSGAAGVPVAWRVRDKHGIVHRWTDGEPTVEHREHAAYNRWTIELAYAAPSAAPAEPWAKDAEEWGNALNEASWAFVEALRDASGHAVDGRTFNHCKPALRAAILKYAAAIRSLSRSGEVK